MSLHSTINRDTVLDYFNLTNKARVGIMGGMSDTVECMQKAAKVIPL